MKILDLYAGIGGEQRRKKIERLGFSLVTLDINPKFNCTITGDILSQDTLDKILLMGPYWGVWASPDCTGMSVASIGSHWGGGKKAYIPKSDTAKMSLKILKRTDYIIELLKPKKWWIENPVGMMRVVGGLDKYIRTTVTYCQYGMSHMKPTDIWTNDIDWATWKAKRCNNGDSCHERAPRGSKTGTQGIKGSAERSVVPWGLWEEILDQMG